MSGSFSFSVLSSFPLARRVAVAAAIVVGASLAIGSAAAAEPPATHEIKAPHYGDTLFHFFQDHHFTAITSLMVSQHFERVTEHGDEAEILRGGMLLSYGLHREAGTIFAQLIEKGASPKVRDRADHPGAQDRLASDVRRQGHGQRDKAA